MTLEPGMDDVEATVANYRESLTDERRFLFDRFRVVDVARQVVGVGSVGTRCWVALLEAVAPADDVPDRIVLQVKEAQPSVLAPFVGPDGRRSPGAAGGGGPAPHPGRQRPLPGVVRGAERPPLLRAPALGREGPGRPDEDGPGQADALRRPLRPCARPRPRPDRRRRGHRRLPRTGAGLRPRDRRVRRELRGRERAGSRRLGRRHLVRSRDRRIRLRRSCCGGSSSM